MWSPITDLFKCVQFNKFLEQYYSAANMFWLPKLFALVLNSWRKKRRWLICDHDLFEYANERMNEWTRSHWTSTNRIANWSWVNTHFMQSRSICVFCFLKFFSFLLIFISNPVRIHYRFGFVLPFVVWTFLNVCVCACELNIIAYID